MGTSTSNSEAAVATAPDARVPARLGLLSETDARVLEGVATGYSTLSLADRLFLSRQGVDYHVGTLLRRFRCPNRPALVAKAYAQGVLRPGAWPPRVVTDFVR
jgi:DNA-binding CsgD family transcriptional regulator